MFEEELEGLVDVVDRELRAELPKPEVGRVMEASGQEVLANVELDLSFTRGDKSRADVRKS